MDKQTQKLLEAIGETLVEIAQQELVAIDLKDSNLYKSVSYEIKDTQITLIMNNYYEFIDKGRRPLITRVPTSVLLKWLKRKGMDTDNKTVYAIQTSIYQQGIKPRPFLQKTFDRIDTELSSELALDFSSVIDQQIKKITK
jgi:hypothetical protein